ncbi:nickel-dependent hydrogenase large subunit [Patescibacteria group bacterium]|nr:nickel-dependent hydrogenase large subunit [Patescibacteria group bacterium]
MITNEFIAKIEGHGSLKIDWSNETVKLHIHEGERLFEGILVGRLAEEAHWITPRICGVCPIAHNLASLRAVEDAYGIKINETSRLLRDLMNCGQMIQSHVLHLFFLVLPDYAGIDRGTELAKKDPQSFAKALALKEAGDEIAYTVAGRNVHPTTTAIGGFHKIPSKNDLEKLLEKLEETRGSAEWTAEFFSKIKYPELKVDLEMVAHSEDKIISNKIGSVLIKEYKENIEEELREYSTAKFGKFQNREMMVGSLARLAVDGKKEKYDLDFQNPFHNNIAQAIEISKFHKQAIDSIDKLLKINMNSTIASTSDVDASYQGIGAIEAPRGGLYHEIHLDEKGIITYANIITPTVQNLTSIEKSCQALIDQTKGQEQKGRERLLNMLVRAYDPCLTCSVH